MSTKPENIFDNFCMAMEKNVKGAQIGTYSIAIIGLTIALRKVRPFSVFRKPSDIPNSFIKSRRELSGIVERIEPDGGLLIIQHKPLLGVTSTDKPGLPVKISNVTVKGHGIGWLQTIVAGNKVSFFPIKKHSNYVQCEVLLPQIARDKRNQNLCIGESLVKAGCASIDNIPKPLSDHIKHLYYIERLGWAEQTVRRRSMGYRYYVGPSKILITNSARRISEILRYIVKTLVNLTSSGQKIAIATK